MPDLADPDPSAPTGVGRSTLVDPMGTVRMDLGGVSAVAAASVDPALTAGSAPSRRSLAEPRDDVLLGRGQEASTGPRWDGLLLDFIVRTSRTEEEPQSTRRFLGHRSHSGGIEHSAGNVPLRREHARPARR